MDHDTVRLRVTIAPEQTIANTGSVFRSPVAVLTACLGLLACTPSGGSADRSHAEPPARARPAGPVDAADAKAIVASLTTGSSPLLQRAAEDFGFVHQGTTAVIEGATAMGRYLEDLRAAYPDLEVRPHGAWAIEHEAWLVTAELARPQADRFGRIAALLRHRRGALVSMEVIGHDVRTLQPREALPPLPAGPDERETLELQPPGNASIPPLGALPAPLQRALGHLGGREASVRLAASGERHTLALVVIEGTTEAQIPITLHVAAVFADPEHPMLFFNPRQLGEVVMTNTALGQPVSSEVQTNALLWSGWQGFCCNQAARSRSCRIIRTNDMPACRATGRLALLCRAAYHCTGSNCFCCSNAIDAACDLAAVPPPKPNEYESRRRAGTVWSPY